jgi:phosphatidylglycerophosphatase A
MKRNRLFPNPSFRDLLRRPVHLLAFGFGAGLAPRAPGTFGTLAAIPVYGLIFWTPWPVYLALVVLLSAAGTYICGRTAKDLDVHDHPGIVWDEIAGFLIAMIAVPVTWYCIVSAFLLFRFFDAVKPWPISWLDRHVKGGWGIMVDDIVAGLFTLGLLHAGVYYGRHLMQS